MEHQEHQSKEEYAIVLDFLQNGYPLDDRPSYKKSPIAQTLGKSKFTLLEIVPKPGIFLQPNEEIYIGEGKRDKVHHIVGKLKYEKLTGTGKDTLKAVIQNIVEKNPERFIQFFNKAQPLTMRMHQLELLPGLGKKHMWEIIEEREIEPFKDFEDIKKRVKLMPDPEKAIIKRIISELSEIQKHYVFVEP
jgi:putative nucleotide binding protein